MAKEKALEILFEDDDFVAVNKPAGLATIPGRAETTSVLEAIGQQVGLPSSGTVDPRIRVVHRLDKDTSGVLLFAKNLPAQRALSEQFQHNKVEKEYLALVTGRAKGEEGSIGAAIGPHPSSRDRMAVRKDGRPARTDWKVEQRFRAATLVRCFPKTGRTHQIRVHMKNDGMPLLVDPLYNTPESADGLFLSSFKRDYRPNRGERERPLIARLTLHAERLTFDHPTKGRMTVQAKLPKDFRAAVNQLESHGR
jgi:23S rRNA pseudouridine955/2504/2580 synthase/23S rRNA pseudouridine1911/1915/1917 synthase